MIGTGAIEAIEAASVAAWPAARSLVVGDWLVGLSDGYTKRANAASAIRSGAALEPALPTIVAAYAAHGRPAQFRLAPLADPGCDVLLAAAGYRRCDTSIVMTADTGATPSTPTVRIATRPDAAWLMLAASIAGHGDTDRLAHVALVTRIEGVTGFATVVDRGVPVGTGIGVVDRGRVGLFDLAIAPAHRGRGHGRALVAGLREWGAAMGACTAWLQVSAANAPAIALYAAAGFAAAYRYHYRVAAGAAVAG